MIDEDCNIVSIIDWQHSHVLPLFLHAGSPKVVQYQAVQISAESPKPELESLETTYLLLTGKKVPLHLAAMTLDKAFIRRRLFEHAASPWEGDNVTLKFDIILAARNWSSVSPEVCPISVDEQEANDIVAKFTEQDENDRRMEMIRASMRIGSDGWVSHDQYDKAMMEAAQTKKEALDDAEDEVERQMLERHWPWDDHDENE